MAYKLEISETQARILVSALDAYSRIYLGQFDTAILDQFLFSPGVSGSQMDAARRLLDETKKCSQATTVTPVMGFTLPKF